MNNFEIQYLTITKDILDNGVKVSNRTGIDSYATWGQQIKVDLEKEFPLITTRKTPLRIAFEETWFFLRGETDTKKLEEKKINIWRGNTSREFLDSRGLNFLPEGHMGKGYGFQWRHFGGDYQRWDGPTSKYDYSRSTGGVDQVVDLLKSLKSDPNSRRHIISSWNPAQFKEMALHPCHILNQYQVLNGKLNSAYFQRSHDWMYGQAFNSPSYALLNLTFAKYLGLKPGILQYFGTDVHLYENQIDMAKEQITRIPYDAPKVIIHKQFKTIDDIFEMEFSDIEVVGYQYHPDFTDKPAMAI